MSLVISDDVLNSARMSAPELGAEIAAFLYERERLTLAQAARLAGMSRFEFQRFLATHDIPLNLDASDLEQDLKSLRVLSRL